MAWLGMAFFFITSIYFYKKYHSHVELTKETHEMNDNLLIENANLRTNWEACKDERDRWYKRYSAGLID